MNIQNHMALDCPCTNTACPRHGDCAACVDNHHQSGSLPFCLRELGKKPKEEKKLERKKQKYT